MVTEGARTIINVSLNALIELATVQIRSELGNEIQVLGVDQVPDTTYDKEGISGLRFTLVRQ